MLVIGLTGGIASGKSTVTHMLRELGATVVDADVAAREVVQPGSEGLAAIVETFGPDILLPTGSLDRAQLGSIVFADAQRRKQLEAITHPRVRALMWEQVAAGRSQGLPAIVLDVPLLIEGGMYQQVDKTWVVYVDRDTQLQRLMARDHLTLQAAETRLAAQMPLDEKLRFASAVIDNRQGHEETRAQVALLWQGTLAKLHADSEPAPD